MTIAPLLDDRSVFLLQEGLGFLHSYTLDEHRKYLPNKYSRTYKPFALYEKNHTDPVAMTFIKNEGIYLPRGNFDTYISLLGGSISDIAFVLENLPDKRLILNETDNSLYGILLSIRDYHQELISIYKSLVGLATQANSMKEACYYYKRIKKAFYENLGTCTLYQSCATLLFLLHMGTNTTPLYGREAQEFYNYKLEALWQWHSVLSSSRISLYHTKDYRSIPLPLEGKNFIIANTPEYAVGDFSAWSALQARDFCKYFTNINNTSDSYLVVSSNTSPMMRSHFTKLLGWHSYRLVTNEVYPVLYYDEKNHKMNIDRVFCCNYPLSISTNTLTPKDSIFTNELLDLYDNYCRSLI